MHPPHVTLITRAQVMTDKIAALVLARLHAVGLLPPVWVPNARELFLGRSWDCDIVISSPNASRSHAGVGLNGGVVEIRDMGSTNGTFVNGERIGEPTVLLPGDRIEIGGKIVTFCRVEAGSAAVTSEDADATVVFSRRGPAGDQGDFLRGDLRQIPMAAVLQVLGEAGTTGLLAITTDNVVSRLWLEDGRVVHAEAGRFRGLDAALRVTLQERGEFVFEGGQTVPDPTLGVSVIELLLEASRRYDESRRGAATTRS